MEEIYKTTPYHKEKWSAKVTTSITKLKIISDQMPEVFFHFPESPGHFEIPQKRGS